MVPSTNSALSIPPTGSDTGPSTSDDVHERWGWTQVFTDISHFLLLLERQYGIANQSFAEYAVSIG